MAKYAADNIMFLKKEYPAIYAQIRGYEMTKHSLTTAKNGLPNIVAESSGKVEAMYSNYNPAMEADRWIQTLDGGLEGSEQVLLYGLGLGYHMETLIERYPNKKYYIIEPDIEVFRAYLESRPMQAVLGHPSIAVIAIGTHSSVHYNIAEVIASNVKGVFTTLATPFYNRVYSDDLHQLKEHMKQYLLNYRGNLATHHTFETTWPKNIITNLPYILASQDISILKNAFEKVPAIIVGSGPSLQYDLETLQRLQDKCIIISAGTSIQALMKYNIRPDLAVSMDGGEPNYRAFTEIDMTQVPLLFTSTIHSGILQKEIKDSIYVSLNLDSISGYVVPELKEVPVFYSTASVTGTAIQAAAFMGCDPVLFAGQDLSYPNDSYYTEGINHVAQDRIDIALSKATLRVDNVRGTQNKTSTRMIHTLNDIVNVITICSDRDYINTSRNGAVIQGTRFKEMDDWEREVTSVCRNKTDSLLNLSRYKRNHSQQRLFSAGYSGLLTLEKELRSQEKRLDILLQTIEKLDAEEMSKKELQRMLEKIQEMWAQLIKSEVFENVLQLTMQSHLMIYTRQIPIIATENDLNKKALLIKEHIGKLCTKASMQIPLLIEWIRDATERIDVLQRENKEV